MENDVPKQKPGRRKKRVPTEPLKLRLDPSTSKMLEELEVYGRIGTSKQEIVMFIVRSWLWENEARLRAAILSIERPFGPPPTG